LYSTRKNLNQGIATESGGQQSFVYFKQFKWQKISTGHFLDTFGAFWMLSGCVENPKMFNVKSSSLKAFEVGDCSHQTKCG